jgi:hypothetical protein
VIKRESTPGEGIPMRGWNVVPWLVVLLIAIACPAAAEDSPLVRRLGPELARQVEALIQSAEAESLPTAPLLGTALEGASKHVAPSRIVAALERHLESLRAARAALGPGVGDPVLVSAAAALRAGVPPESLASLHAARPGQSLLVPLVVLGDLIARRVPPDAGGRLVISLVRAGVSDDELMRVREGIDADIRTGVAPLESAGVRVHALLRSQPVSGVPPGPARPTLHPPERAPGERP